MKLKKIIKSKKTANIVFISIFIVFFYSIAVVTTLSPKQTTSYYENRGLARRPILDFSIMADDDYFGSWDTYLTDHAAGRQTLVRLGTMINLDVLRRPVENGVVTSSGMYLGFNEFETVDSGRIHKQAEAIADELEALNSVITSYGGAFYYVAAPGQYTYFSERYPWYLNNRDDYTKAELEAFTSALERAGINLIDMGEVFTGLGNPPEFYSASDYHFTFYGAYETYRTVVGRINSDGVYALPLYGEDDMEFVTLPNPYMGSRMRKLMNVPGITERTAIAVLSDPVPFTRTDNGILLEAADVYAIPLLPWETVNFGVYMGGDVAETVIDTGRELPSVLIYGDSFTNPVECLMYASCGVMRSIDLRHYRDMPLSEYIERYRPDIVICVRDYEVLLSFDGNGKVMP